MPASSPVVRRPPAANDPSVVKKLLIAVSALVVVGAIAWVPLSGFLGKVVATGKQGAEDWCGKQLLAIAADHLNPTLHFDELVYTFPKTVQLTNVTLVDADVVVISADAITIEFAGIPKRGEPVVLQTIDLRKPQVRLIEHPDGSLAGLTDLVKDSGGSVKDDGGSTRLSDVLAIKKINLVEGSVSYEPPDKPAMVLKPLTFELDKRLAESAEPGWYAFEATTRLDPVADITTKSRLNLDNGDLDIESFTLDMSLAESQYQVFTPNIQEFLKDNAIVGTMNGSMKGLVGLGTLSHTSLDFHVRLSDARAVIDGYEIPIQALDLDGSYKQNVLDFPRLTGNAFHGKVHATARLDYSAEGSPFNATLDAVEVRLEDAMGYEGMPSTDYTGEVTLKAEVAGQQDDVAGTITGGGQASVKKGRIVLVELFRKQLKKGGEHRQNDRAEFTFEVHGDRIHYPKAVILGDLVGIRGRGDMYYDGRINFVVSAGAIERVTGDAGPVGRFMGKLAGSLVQYQVTGTMDDTKVKVLPLGIGEKKEPVVTGE